MHIINVLYLHNIFYREKRNKVFEHYKISKRKYYSVFIHLLSFNFSRGRVQLCHQLFVSDPAVQTSSIHVLLHSEVLNI